LRRIVVSQRVDVVENRAEARDALDQKLVQFFVEIGFLTYPVPNSLVELQNGELLKSWLQEIKPQAIVLSGGNNIGDFTSRDKTEGALIRYASSEKLPLLGICRGMQMIAHYHGASLVPLTGHVRKRHRLDGEVSWEVNSFHDFAIESCPTSFKVFATCTTDGSVEGIKHDYLPWEGWMWHPEREDSFCELQLARAKRLLMGEISN